MMTTEGYDFNTKGHQIGLSVQKKICLVKIYIMFIGANYYVFFPCFVFRTATAIPRKLLLVQRSPVM